MGSDQIFFNGSFLLGTYSDIWLERVPAFFGGYLLKSLNYEEGWFFKVWRWYDCLGFWRFCSFQEGKYYSGFPLLVLVLDLLFSCWKNVVCFSIYDFLWRYFFPSPMGSVISVTITMVAQCSTMLLLSHIRVRIL